MSEIEFVDLAAQRRALDGRIEMAISTVVDHGAYVMGPEVKELEQLLVESNASLACTKSLLIALISGEVFTPEIKFHEIDSFQRDDPPEPDHEAQRLKHRLGKASRILKKKRERTH